MKKLAEKLLSFNSDSSVIDLENDHEELSSLAEIATNKKYLKDIDCKIGYFNKSFWPLPTKDDFEAVPNPKKLDLLPCYIHVSYENPVHRKIMMMNGEKAIERYNNSYIMNYVYNDNTFRLLSDKWLFRAWCFKSGNYESEYALVDLGYDKDLNTATVKSLEGYQNLNYIDKNGNLISPHINFENIDPQYLTWRYNDAFIDNTTIFSKSEYAIDANRGNYKNFEKYKKIFYDNIKESVQVELNKECFKQIIGPKYAKKHTNEYFIDNIKYISHAYLFRNGDIALFVKHPKEKVFYYVKQSKNAGFAINEKLLTFSTDSSVIGDTDSIEAIKKVFDENYYLKKYKISTIHPKNTKELNEIIFAAEREEAQKHGAISSIDELKIDLNWIDVSNVRDMSYLFFNSKNMNYDISKWDVSNVVNMKAMFYGCGYFNCDISNWDVSNVDDMSYMFQGCISFNQDISKWDVSNVQAMRAMFQDCVQFDKDLSNWNVSSATDMLYMFKNCRSIIFDVQKWDVPKDCVTGFMFDGASYIMRLKRPTKVLKKVNEKLLSFTNDSSVISNDDNFGAVVEVGRNKKRFEEWHIEYGMPLHKSAQFKDEYFIPIYTSDPDILESHIKMWYPTNSSVRYKFSEETPKWATNYIINDGSYRFLIPYWFDYVYVFTDHDKAREESAVVFRHAKDVNNPNGGLYNFIDPLAKFISPKIWFKSVDCPFADNSRIWLGKELILRDKKYEDYIKKYAQDSALVRLTDSDFLKEYLQTDYDLNLIDPKNNVISILYRNGDILLVFKDSNTFEPFKIIKQTDKDIKDTYDNLQEKLLSFSSDSSTIDLEKDSTLVDLRNAAFVKNRRDWLKKNTDYDDAYKFIHNSIFNYTDPATMAPGILLLNNLRDKGLMQIYTTDIPNANVFKNPKTLPFMNFVKIDGSYKLISDIWFSNWRSPNNYTPGAKLENQGCLGFYSTRANRIVQACIPEDILKTIICFVFINAPRSGATFIEFFGLIATDGKLYKLYNAKTNEVYFDYASFRRECIENENDMNYAKPSRNPWDGALAGVHKNTSNLNTFYIKEVSEAEMHFLKVRYSIKALFNDTSYDVLPNDVEMNEKLLTFSTDSSVIDDSERRDSKDVTSVLLKNEFDKRYVDVNDDEFYSSEDSKYIEFDFGGRHMRKCKTKNAKISYEFMLAKEPDEINVSRAYNFYDTETYEIIFPYFCVSNPYGSGIWRGAFAGENILWNSTSKNNKYIEKRNYIKMLVGNSSDSRDFGKYYYFFIDEDYEIILVTMYYSLPQSPAMNYEYCEQMRLNLNARDPKIYEKLRELVLSGTLDENVFKNLFIDRNFD